MNPAATHFSSAVANGFALSLALIVAIGAQNAFLLRQGLQRRHVGVLVAFFALSDALLVALGVAGFAQLVQRASGLASALAAVGAVFLLGYGLLALRRSFRRAALVVDARAVPVSRTAILWQAAGFTFLNPHVYLDTVLLVGGSGAQYAPPQQPWFVLGAGAASASWFALLGGGARWLAPVFARPRAWQWLDALVGLTMLLLAARLAQQALAAWRP